MDIDGSVKPEQLLQFFTQAGEVKYVRMAGDQGGLRKCAFIEFSDLAAVNRALQLNGSMMNGKPIRYVHNTYKTPRLFSIAITIG